MRPRRSQCSAPAELTTISMTELSGKDLRRLCNPGRTFDISPDGQRLLMMKDGSAEATAAPTSLIVVQHWAQELARLVPTK